MDSALALATAVEQVDHAIHWITQSLSQMYLHDNVLSQG